MENIFYLALIILSGMTFGRLVEKIKVPAVTGYIISGVIIGPHAFGLVTIHAIEGMDIISQVAIGFVAFTIGTELWFPKIKKSGIQVAVITVMQAFFATGLVIFALIFIFKQEVYIALILGAIATATAPEPIIAITRKYKSKGPVTDTLIPLVALDDALGIIIFGVMLSVSKALYYQTGDLSLSHILFDPIREIGISILVGTVIGYFLGMLVKSVDREDVDNEKDETYLDLTLAAIFLSVSLADFLHASHILLPMTVGVVFTNQIGKQTFDRESHVVEGILQPILIIFFALAGASLELSSIMNIGLVGIGYIVFRIIGKTLGTYIGARITKAHSSVEKYLGITLLPQAGVAIGLALAAKSAIPGEVGDTLQTIALATTVVFAVTGPVFVRIGLQLAKELKNN